MPSRNQLILVVLAATLFGFFAGMVGSIVARVYFLEELFNVPLVGGIDLSADPSRQSIVIRDARKVVIEQSQKIAEVAASAKGNIMTIRERIKAASSSPVAKGRAFSLEDFYIKDEFLAGGFVITSDGWVLSTFVPEKIALLQDTKAGLAKELEKYAMIDNNGKIFEVENIIIDEISNLAYWKIVARDLPVKKFILSKDIYGGQTLVLAAAQGELMVADVSAVKQNNGALVRSSDQREDEIILSGMAPKENFYGAFALDLAGDLAGVVDADGRILAIDNYLSCINCLLTNKNIARTWFGVNYINLSELIPALPNDARNGAWLVRNEKTAAVEKFSPAEKAGLREGDIITSINSSALNKDNDLSRLLSSFRIGDEIEVEYERAGAINKTKVKLAARTD